MHKKYLAFIVNHTCYLVPAPTTHHFDLSRLEETIYQLLSYTLYWQFVGNDTAIPPEGKDDNEMVSIVHHQAKGHTLFPANFQKPVQQVNDEMTSSHAIIDALASANAIFSATVFVGMLFSSDPSSSQSNATSLCTAGPEVFKRLVLFEILSFTSFLVSALLLTGLKLYINLKESKINFEHKVTKEKGREARERVTKKWRDRGLIASATGFLVGFGFLMAGIEQMVEIRLGRLSCESKYSIPAVSILAALVIFILVFLAVTVRMICGHLDRQNDQSRTSKTAASNTRHRSHPSSGSGPCQDMDPSLSA
ncbi:hypothetical protein SAY86_006941 [Trapa natans]|uniref:Uncharacterized protein n=1 Tax=Trapa natans TaxID=22666 RepID=A0AAN7KZR7_TRANT|nr:hypothetical protein SAY86_006941 [Trapa natans]